MLVNSDPPEHGRYRRMLTYPFTAKRVEALRPAIQQITDELIDTMLAGPGRPTWSRRWRCPCPR